MSEFEEAMAEVRRTRRFAPFGTLLRSGYEPTPHEWDVIDALALNVGPQPSPETVRMGHARWRYQQMRAEHKERGERVSTDVDIATLCREFPDLDEEKIREAANGNSATVRRIADSQRSSFGSF